MARMVVDPEAQGPEGRVDPSVAALIDRDLRERMGPVTAYARQQIESPFWPIGLCVAWLLPQIQSGRLIFMRGIGWGPNFGRSTAGPRRMRGLFKRSARAGSKRWGLLSKGGSERRSLRGGGSI